MFINMILRRRRYFLKNLEKGTVPLVTKKGDNTHAAPVQLAIKENGCISQILSAKFYITTLILSP